MKRSVLFVCVQNGARSQMAEAFLNEICPDDFAAESAGLEPGELNPLAVAAMREAGIDISSKQTKAVFDLFKTGKLYSYVVTVCDETSAERCPIFPGKLGVCIGAFADPVILARFVGRMPRANAPNSRRDSHSSHAVVRGNL